MQGAINKFIYLRDSWSLSKHISKVNSFKNSYEPERVGIAKTLIKQNISHTFKQWVLVDRNISGTMTGETALKMPWDLSARNRMI